LDGGLFLTVPSVTRRCNSKEAVKTAVIRTHRVGRLKRSSHQSFGQVLELASAHFQQ